MANRRMGNRTYNYYQNMNPWQDGALPVNNQGYNTGGMSQLVDPTQIALAITNLLKPQQSQSVPSLLSLPPIAPVRNSGYGSSSGGSYLPNYMHGNRMNMMNIRNSRGMDFNKRQNNSNRKPQQRKSNVFKNVAKSKVNKNSEISKTKQKSKSSKLTDGKSSAESNDNKESEDIQSENHATTKRSWKEEKKSKVDGKVAEHSGDENDSKDSNNKDLSKNKYTGIPISMLQCFICQKRMWDGESFEKHIRGKAHQEMFNSYEESCKIKADMMRESMRLAEEKNWIEANRLKRLGKRVTMNMESHCNMCNLDFIGKLSVHRKSQGHKKLKHFIHPRCSECQKEFQTKIEYEHHRLTPSHMKNRLLNLINKKEDSVPIEHEEANEDSEAMEECEDSINKDLILDVSENIKLENSEDHLPHYSKKYQYGTSFVAEISGQQCKLCNLFFTSETAANGHLNSAKHYIAFIEFLINEKNKIKQNEKSSSPDQNNDEGNWKRRKMSEENMDVDNNVENSEEKIKTEIYDPVKAENEHSESENDASDLQKSNEENESNEVQEDNIKNLKIEQNTEDKNIEEETKKEITSTRASARKPRGGRVH